MLEKVMSFLMYVISPPPALSILSMRTAVYLSIFGVFDVFLSLVS